MQITTASESLHTANTKLKTKHILLFNIITVKDYFILFDMIEELLFIKI